MSESKFLTCVFTEGILLLFLGLGMLILPKITIISFGLMMCLSFILYGGYKIVSAIITRNFSRHYILDVLVGTILSVTGILLFTAPMFDIMLIIGLSGIYFTLKSIASSSFAIQTRKTLNFWWMCLLLSLLELFFGIITIIVLP